MLVADQVFAADEVGGIEGGDESIEKCGKLSKTGKSSKFQKLSTSQKLKFQKSAKSRQKLSKSGNLPNFDVKENGPSFLTPDARTTFNHLWLAFTKALIFQHFDPEYHI